MLIKGSKLISKVGELNVDIIKALIVTLKKTKQWIKTTKENANEIIQQLIKEKKKWGKWGESEVAFIADGVDLLTGLLVEPIRTNFYL